jgi:putative acetyltransferase
MRDFLIRPERNDDAAAIYAVTLEAFTQPAEADLVNALRASGDAVCSLVAEVDGAIVGHVMLSKLASPARCLGLAPLSVLPSQQKLGIGAALMTRAIEITAHDGWLAVFLLADPAYYSRFGFRVDAAAKFETPYPKEYIMALELTPGALENLSGAIRYAAPFSAFA